MQPQLGCRAQGGGSERVLLVLVLQGGSSSYRVEHRPACGSSSTFMVFIRRLGQRLAYSSQQQAAGAVDEQLQCCNRLWARESSSRVAATVWGTGSPKGQLHGFRADATAECSCVCKNCYVPANLAALRVQPLPWEDCIRKEGGRTDGDVFGSLVNHAPSTKLRDFVNEKRSRSVDLAHNEYS